MSDPFNGKPDDTPQDRAASYNSNSMQLDDDTALAFERLYQEGCQALAVAGFIVERDATGAHCGHNVYRVAPPRPIKGVSIPPWFRVKRLVETEEEEGMLAATISCNDMLSPEARAFWMPLTNPKSGQQVSELRGYVDRLIRVDNAYSSQHEDEPFELGISFHPAELERHPKAAPRAYVPERSWFKPSLHSLRFSDIVTLWPEAECQMLQLILGRVAVGRNNHIPTGRDEPVRHTFRSAAIIVGEDPGMGKSTTFNLLFSALVKTGYKRSNFRNLSDRFNLGQVVKADIAYKDDVVSKTLKTLLAEEATKIIVSGGQLLVEDKFENGYNVWANSVVIANTNEYDPRISYDLDPGIVDRMKLLSTYRKSELAALEAESSSPSLAPDKHTEYLADLHGVEPATIWLWAFRLAADYFEELILDKSVNNRLAEEVQYVTSKLRLQFNKDVTRQTMGAIALFNFLYCLEQYTEDGETLPELSKAHTDASLKAFNYLAVNQEFYRARALIKRHWEITGRQDSHPWLGIRKLNLNCLKYVELASRDALAANVQLKAYIDEVFSKFSYRDGFSGSKDIVWVTKSWETVRFEQRTLLDLAQRVKICMTDNKEEFTDCLKGLRKKNAVVNYNYLDDVTYSPQRIGESHGEFNELVDSGVFDGWLVD